MSDSRYYPNIKLLDYFIEHPELWNDNVKKFCYDSRKELIRIEMHQMRHLYSSQRLFDDAVDVAIELVDDGVLTINDIIKPGHHKPAYEQYIEDKREE